MKKNTKIIILILSIVVIVCVAIIYSLTGVSAEQKKYDKHIEASQKYIDELNYEKAIAELELAIEIDPNNAKAYLALAEVYVEMGDYEAAALVLEEAKENVDNNEKIDTLLDAVREFGKLKDEDVDGEVYDSLVSDAICYTVYDESFSENTHCYHIPRIHVSDSDEINDKIYKELDFVLQSEVFADDIPYLSEMEYTWGKKDEMISILVETNQMHAQKTQYYVYNLSSQTGKEISKEDLLETYNLSATDFYDLAYDTIQKYWKSEEELVSNFGQGLYDNLVALSLEEENVKASVPYINSNGELCIIANIFSPAGSGSSLLLLNTVNGVEENIVECGIIH